MKGFGRSHSQGKTVLQKTNSKTLDGYSVFGNPALPVPENPKAEHPIQKSKFQTEIVLNQVRNTRGNALNPHENPRIKCIRHTKDSPAKAEENVPVF